MDEDHQPDLPLHIHERNIPFSKTDIGKIMGFPDDLKLRSSMTLFNLAEPTCDVFQKVLNKYFYGKPDEKTLAICGMRQ